MKEIPIFKVNFYGYAEGYGAFQARSGTWVLFQGDQRTKEWCEVLCVRNALNVQIFLDEAIFFKIDRTQSFRKKSMRVSVLEARPLEQSRSIAQWKVILKDD